MDSPSKVFGDMGYSAGDLTGYLAVIAIGNSGNFKDYRYKNIKNSGFLATVFYSIEAYWIILQLV